ncbi:MAG: hypothetical protein HQL87_07955 [Magnetococcales bacterium]|nr:hypothetical protein [Magnetococcales bacterium]
MRAIVQNPNNESVRQSARHTLYVEGAGQNALDPLVLAALLGSKIQIKAIGPAYHVRSVAEALFRHHPDSCFLMDRDHHTDDAVESTWRNFPDPNQSNLLIWRKREIENYFLDPDYLRKSSYYKEKTGEPERSILHHANERLYLDAVNHVIVTIREEQKRNWIELFNNPGEFRTEANARQRLMEASAFAARIGNVTASLASNRLQSLLDETIKDFSGGSIPLQFGKGCWRDRLRGKSILASVVPACFKVEGRQKQTLQGKEQREEVVKDLLRRPLAEQPADFQTLHGLIMARLELPPL